MPALTQGWNQKLINYLQFWPKISQGAGPWHSYSNVAWTNVTMTVGICSRCSQEPIFKVSSKSGQLELRYS